MYGGGSLYTALPLHIHKEAVSRFEPITMAQLFRYTSSGSCPFHQSNASHVTRDLPLRPPLHRILLHLHSLLLPRRTTPGASTSHARARHVSRHVLLRSQNEDTAKPCISVCDVFGGVQRRRRRAPLATQVRSRVPRALHRRIAQ